MRSALYASTADSSNNSTCLCLQPRDNSRQDKLQWGDLLHIPNYILNLSK